MFLKDRKAVSPDGIPAETMKPISSPSELLHKTVLNYCTQESGRNLVKLQMASNTAWPELAEAIFPAHRGESRNV